MINRKQTQFCVIAWEAQTFQSYAASLPRINGKDLRDKTILLADAVRDFHLNRGIIVPCLIDRVFNELTFPSLPKYSADLKKELLKTYSRIVIKPFKNIQPICVLPVGNFGFCKTTSVNDLSKNPWLFDIPESTKPDRRTKQNTNISRKDKPTLKQG